MASLNNIGGLHYEMMKRCYNEKSVAFKDYGAKGIVVCEEWHDRDVFRKWCIENGYIKGMRLERVDCSKGTYIRTLCDDIGRTLGCFAHMSGLTRTRSGRFDISESYTLEQIEDMFSNGDMSFMTPIDKIFDEYDRLVITGRKAKKMCNGTQISVQGAVEGKTYRVYDEVGNFLTISKAEDGVMKILKTFYQTIDGGGAAK